MREEETIQAAICHYLAVAAPSVVVFAIPNSSTRTRGGRASNAVPGLRKGVFDLALILPSGVTAYCEVKTDRGKLTAEQEEFRLELIRRGVPHLVARSIEDMRAALRAWRIETREHEHSGK